MPSGIDADLLYNINHHHIFSLFRKQLVAALMRYTGWFVLIDKNEKFNVRQMDFLEAASNLEPPILC